MEHADKPKRELNEKADQSDIPDVALFLDEHVEKRERRSTSTCDCDPSCNPCVLEWDFTQDPNVCKCKDKNYCMQQKDKKDCKVNATWLLEKLLPFTDSTPKQLELICTLSP